MKRFLLTIAATTLVAGASAQPGGGGPGMMGGRGQGPGPGSMMDDYGGGPGWDAYHRGPGWGGMMGPGMMGPGMMGFDGRYWALDLSDAQRDKILSIERAASRKQWELMGKMHDQRLRMRESYVTGKSDEDTLRKNYQVMSDVHKEMFESSLQARKDIDAVLTAEQRSQLAQPGAGRGKR